MLNAKIKISQVNNLTDARYFSAWGVNYLGFDVLPNSPRFIAPPLVKEIAEWIEGPKIFLESSDAVDKIWINNYLEALGSVLMERKIDNQDNLIGLYGESLDGKKVVTYKSSLSWSSISRSYIEGLVRSYDEVFVDIPFGDDDIGIILDSGISGFVLRGGEEEKTGFKSYDDLDKVFDRIAE